MFENVLRQLGLSEKEAKVYDFLLKKGSSSVAEILKNVSLKKGDLYNVLYSLEETGLVIKEKKEKKLHFRAKHPYNLQRFLESKITEVESQKETLKALLPTLVSTYVLTEKEPGVQFFEGVEGIKKAYNDTLKEGKEIWAILQTENVDPKIYDWLTKYYVKKRARRKIFAKVIVAEDKRAKDYVAKDRVEYRQSRLVPKDKFPIGIEVDIYGDKVAFMGFRENSDKIAIIIENKFIAETMRAFFILAWEKAAQYKKVKDG